VDIFAGRIRSWNEPRLRAANPGLNLPNRSIALVARQDSRQGSIVQAGGGWELRPALEEIGLSVPESLRHMIDRQLDRLTPDEQRLLEAASVSGGEF
jgi:hypothetical protein